MIESPVNPFEYRKVATDNPLIDDIYRLRYKVYCEEWGFERPQDHPGGLEEDPYDDCSTHFGALRRDTQQIIGTIRIINHSEKGFPIEKHFRLSKDLSSLDKSRCGEISRLAVSKDYRRRATDAIVFDRQRDTVEPTALDSVFEGRRRVENSIVVGLYKCVYRESVEKGYEYLFAVMASGLFLLLKRVGIVFEPIGPTQSYHGLRAPYLGRIETMLQALLIKNPALYVEFAARSGPAAECQRKSEPQFPA